MRWGRLWWFGHVERKEVDDWVNACSPKKRPNGTSRPHPGPLYADKFAGSPRQATLCQLSDQIWDQTGLCPCSLALLQSHGLDHGPCDAPPRRYLEKASRIQTMWMTLQPLTVTLLTSPGPCRALRLPAQSWACTSPGRKRRSRT